jgi:hypothetical protein
MVQDQRGQLLAQGIATAGQSMAQGFQAYQQNKIRNQAIQGENEALLKVFASDPELKKYAPEGLDKFLDKSMKGGGLSLKDNVQLNGMLNTTLKTKGVIQDQAAQRQQQEMNEKEQEYKAMQMAELQRRNAILQENQRQLENLRRMDGLAKTNGVLNPQAQAAAAEYLNNPAARARLDLDKAGLDSGAESALKYLELGLKKAQPTPLVFNSEAELEKRYPATKWDYKAQPLPGGRIAIPDGVVNPRGLAPKTILSADEQVDVALRTEEGKLTLKDATDYTSSITKKAELAQATLPQMQEVEKLYESGAKSGFGQDFITSGGALALRLGWGDAKTQADREELQKLLAQNALVTARELMQGTGTISDFERKKVDQASADVGKSPEANLRIIRYARALAERSVDLELMRQSFEDEGLKKADIQKKVARWSTENPLEKYITRAKKESKEKASGTPAAPSPIDSLLEKYK